MADQTGSLGTFAVDLKATGLEVVQAAFAGISAGMAKLAAGAAASGQQMTSAMRGAGAQIAGLSGSLSGPIRRRLPQGGAQGAQIAGLSGSLSGLGQTAFAGVGGAFSKLSGQVQGGSALMGKSLVDATSGLAGLGGALGGIAGKLEGYARAGLGVASEGQVLSLQFREISRQIGSLFIPQLVYASAKLQDLIGWFRGLSGEQQKSLGFWGTTVIGMTAVSTIVPRVTGAFAGMKASVRGLTLAFQGMRLAYLPLLFGGGALAGLAGVAGLAVLGSKGASIGKVASGAADAGAKLASGFSAAGEAINQAATALGKVVNDSGDWLQKVLAIKGAVGETGHELTGLSAVYVHFRELSENLIGGMVGKAGGPQLQKLMDAFAGKSSPLGAFLDRLAGRQQDKGKRKELSLALGGFESSEATWHRMALSSRQVPLKSHAEVTNEKLDGISTKIADIIKEIQGSKPIIR